MPYDAELFRGVLKAAVVDDDDAVVAVDDKLELLLFLWAGEETYEYALYAVGLFVEEFAVDTCVAVAACVSVEAAV